MKPVISVKSLARIITLLGVLAGLYTSGAAQSDEESKIDSTIMKFIGESLVAPAIVEFKRTEVEVKNLNESIIRVHRRVLVKDKKAQEEGGLSVGYNRLREIKNLKMTMFDENGKVLSKLKKNEFEDVLAFDGVSFYTDNRVKRAYLSREIFPYTIEYEYELKNKGTLSLGDFYPQENVPVREASLSVTVPLGFPVIHQAFNLDIEPVVITKGKKEVYSWRVENMPSYTREVLQPNFGQTLPRVLIRGAQFAHDGHQGSLKTWEEFSTWYYNLNNGRQELPAKAKADIDALIEGLTDDREKAKAIYKYMQSFTRYVSVQLGIGGLQTFAADYVFENKYGDCKALTNFTLSALRYAGITSYAAAVRAGDDAPDIDSSFPSSQFNHVILSVPMVQDTVWLECTSQSSPFNFLGDFTEDRDVLLMKPEGGELVRTPASTHLDNRKITRATVAIERNGNGKAVAVSKMYGNEGGDLRGIKYGYSSETLDSWVRDQIDLPSFNIARLEARTEDEFQAEPELELELVVPKLATPMGKRMFLKPALLEKRSWYPEEDDNRVHPVRITTYPYQKIDSVQYSFPEGYVPEAVPDHIHVKNEFGEFLSKIEFSDDNTMLFVRKLEIREKILPAEQFNEYRNFLKDVATSDKSQVVLVKR